MAAEAATADELLYGICRDLRHPPIEASEVAHGVDLADDDDENVLNEVVAFVV
jgi:hypothetical protein